MPKFKLICEHSPEYVITHEFEEDYLPDVLDGIDLFIRGCGFIAQGELDYVEDGDFRESKVREPASHSEFYYDTTRNRPIK